MTTRCKFLCQKVAKQYDSYKKCFTYEAEFYAVSSGSEENKSFFEYTPSGSLRVATYKDDVFAPGKQYYLDISEAPE